MSESRNHIVFPPPKLRFSIEDADRAHAEWGANCGPGAIAAICGLTLDEVREYMGDFEKKHYTNPTLMWQVLERLWPAYGIGYHCRPKQANAVPLIWPAYGLARIQWEGRWTQPGVPMPARYRHTHWVGACSLPGNTGIFDINAIGNGTGWTPESDWASLLVPSLIADLKGADGNWHITHCVEIMLPEHIRKRA